MVHNSFQNRMLAFRNLHNPNVFANNCPVVTKLPGGGGADASLLGTASSEAGEIDQAPE